MECHMHPKGFSVAIMMPFAHEDDEQDEDALQHDNGDAGENDHFASGDQRRKYIDLRIKLAESEMKFFKALRDGDEEGARRNNKDMERYDRELTRLRGQGGEDDSESD